MKYTESHYNSAMTKYKEKKYRDVIKEMNIYLNEDRNNGIDARGLLALAKAYTATGDRRESIKIYKVILKLDPQNIHARLELGKLYASQGKKKEAEKLFLKTMELNSNDIHARLELGKLYASQGKEKEAEKLFQEYMELGPKNVHARLELGKLYAKQGREQDAERLFQGNMELDPQNMHARMELGRLYASQGKREESQKLYEYIMDKIGNEIFDKENRAKHIIKHLKDDKSKEQHGVFVKDPFEILKEIKEQMVEENKKIGYMSDIYLIHSEGCGYEGGKKGDGHTLDYITVVTLPNSNDFITMFPSDNIFELDKDEKMKKVDLQGDDEVGEER